ncbi:DUF3318 domain-containing protein [Geitlerinema sp. PCC 9228]|jgi:hypothetical protein|uniref:DUF3318 domain-containing protein n=1 Tax=Geitlerinema sp. PCC 9228 TaxID=111611 RepID=UPI000A01C071
MPEIDPSEEISRLLDLMPASARMATKLVSKSQQIVPIEEPVALPWKRNYQILINFDLWSEIPLPQRDLLLLRAVAKFEGTKWFRLEWPQGVVAAGAFGTIFELSQGDAIGILVAGGLSALAANRIWRAQRGVKAELRADEEALRLASRRGYSKVEAAKALLDGIATVAKLEGRSSLNFMELVRSQNLKAIAGVSPVGMPQRYRDSDE